MKSYAASTSIWIGDSKECTNTKGNLKKFHFSLFSIANVKMGFGAMWSLQSLDPVAFKGTKVHVHTYEENT